MKKLLFGLILLCSTPTWADNTFAIDDFTIKAGEEKVIEVKMYNDVTFTAFQFELGLPEGVTVKSNQQTNKLYVSATNRLKVYDDFEDTYTPTHSVVTSLQTSGLYKIMVYSDNNANIQGNSGTSVLRIQIVASDQVVTGSFTPSISNIEMTTYDSGNQTTTKYKPANTTYSCTVNIETTVTTLGYASFSWPKALDFTNSGLTAYIATTCNGSSLHLESVTKVPANTGLILKGTAGSENTYSLETTDETTDDVSSNLLSANTENVYTVASDDIYVLSNLDDGKPGFYLASQGIHVGKYKSYLQYSAGARKGLTFDESSPTGIADQVSAATGGHYYYDLQGRRVANPSSGVYVKEGKKVILK